MADKRSLTLNIAGKKDFVILKHALFLLVILSVLLSPQPFMLAIFSVLLVGAGWVSRILYFSKVNVIELTLVIFTDGQISLSSNCGDMEEGFLDGQQWCTRRIAVLRVATASKTHNLIVLPGQQAPDEYRRLNVWLRHGAALLLKSEGRV